MAAGAQIDYDALAQKHGAISPDSGSVDYDALAKKHGAVPSASEKPEQPGFFESLGAGLPGYKKDDAFSAVKDAGSGLYHIFTHPLDSANLMYHGVVDPMQLTNEDAVARMKKAGVANKINGAIEYAESGVPFLGPQLAKAGQQFEEGNVAGGLGTTAGAAIPFVAPAAAEGAMATGSKVLSKMDPLEAVKSALARKMSVEEAAAPRSASESQPALNISPNDVLTHASKEGVKLTPGQALEDPSATNVQKMGTTAMYGGKDLSLALREQRRAFVDSVNKLGKTVDPNGIGINDETAGHTIQKNVQDNLNGLREKANATYNQVAQQQQDLSGDIRGLKDFAESKRTETITDPRTGASSTRPIYQSPEIKATLDDIAGKQDTVGPNPSIASLRSLRSELWEKGNDYSGNIPDSSRALYKQAAAKVDDAIVEAGKGTPFERTFRDANSQWKALQSKYNEPGQPLYKILQQDDPTKIVSQLQNAPATDIAMLRKELNDGPAVQALRRSVVNDISNNKFTVRNGGLGGYSHEYLTALFGPDVTKELYMKSDLARRIGYDANPSGTGSAISVLEQGGNIKNQPKLTAFAKLSMPRDPLSFLPPKAQVTPIRATPFARPATLAPTGTEGASGITSPLTGGPLASPEQLFKGGINQKGVEASNVQMSPEDTMTSLSTEIGRMKTKLRNAGNASTAEKSSLQKQIEDYQGQLDDLRGKK
jgi:hypothetical protein